MTANQQSSANTTSKILRAWVEPWCDEFEIPSGSTLILTYQAGTDLPVINVGELFFEIRMAGGYTGTLEGKPVSTAGGDKKLQRLLRRATELLPSGMRF